MIKFLYFILLVFATSTTLAKNFYFSTSLGNDSRSIHEAENPNTPWKSIYKLGRFFPNLAPGDSVFFRKGETFIGNLYANKSGTMEAPIVISSYGSGSQNPVFQYELSKKNYTTVQRSIIYIPEEKFINIENITLTDTTINSLDHTTAAHVGYGINMDKNASNITLKGLNISLIGIGAVLSSHNLVCNCHFNNMRMVVNTPVSVANNDDYGANGVVVMGTDNTIEDCFFKELWASSYDYGYDGGAIELFGGCLNNNKVVHNEAVNCNGFIEVGSGKNGNAVDDFIAYNLVVNTGCILVLHLDGAFAVNITNLGLFNNTVVETVEQFTRPGSLILTSKSIGDSRILNMQNNVFWVATNSTIVTPSSTLTKPSRLVHSRNVYHLKSGNVGFEINKSELILNLSTKIFKNTTGSDPVRWDLHPSNGSVIIGFGRNISKNDSFDQPKNKITGVANAGCF